MLCPDSSCALVKVFFPWFSFHFDGAFGSVLCSKCAIDLEHECATCGVGSNMLENRVSLQFASWKRYKSNQKGDRFGGFSTPKSVPNVLHIWTTKMFQMCRTFGVRPELTPIARARLGRFSFHFDGTFGCVL